MNDQELQNRRILVVEDDYFLAMVLEETLGKAGAVVVGPAPTVEAALVLIERDVPLDGATLDINLGGEWVYPVADRLTAKGVPFMFITGYSGRGIPERYTAAPRAEKPVDPCAVARTLAGILKEKNPSARRRAPGRWRCHRRIIADYLNASEESRLLHPRSRQDRASPNDLGGTPHPGEQHRLQARANGSGRDTPGPCCQHIVVWANRVPPGLTASGMSLMGDPATSGGLRRCLGMISPLLILTACSARDTSPLLLPALLRAAA